jgi:hypothetical protein
LSPPPGAESANRRAAPCTCQGKYGTASRPAEASGSHLAPGRAARRPVGDDHKVVVGGDGRDQHPDRDAQDISRRKGKDAQDDDDGQEGGGAGSGAAPDYGEQRRCDEPGHQSGGEGDLR